MRRLPFESVLRCRPLRTSLNQSWQASESLPLYRFHPDAYECSRIAACLHCKPTLISPFFAWFCFTLFCFIVLCFASSRLAFTATQSNFLPLISNFLLQFFFLFVSTVGPANKKFTVGAVQALFCASAPALVFLKGDNNLLHWFASTGPVMDTSNSRSIWLLVHITDNIQLLIGDLSFYW